MSDNAEKLANLKVELENVKLQISKYEAHERNESQEKTYSLLLKEKISLKEDIKALEGLLFIVSPFTELFEIDQIVHKCR
jgi:hypothetical protein